MLTVPCLHSLPFLVPPHAPRQYYAHNLLRREIRYRQPYSWYITVLKKAASLVFETGAQSLVPGSASICMRSSLARSPRPTLYRSASWTVPSVRRHTSTKMSFAPCAVVRCGIDAVNATSTADKRHFPP
eukprot:1086769-Rhodomonas_salina.2